MAGFQIETLAIVGKLREEFFMCRSQLFEHKMLAFAWESVGFRLRVPRSLSQHQRLTAPEVSGAEAWQVCGLGVWP